MTATGFLRYVFAAEVRRIPHLPPALRRRAPGSFGPEPGAGAVGEPAQQVAPTGAGKLEDRLTGKLHKARSRLY